ncbi:hypothetical protein [Winogradskyella sp.]|uniref:hypothetical protein n=1 Tax=Winogradskyella sp. TaxID=1883156 RepID=UPI002619C0D0|nr:hypothetical protein [Winogradskyella sp.]
MRLNKLFIFLVFSFIISCKNHYNETIEWADNLQNGLSIESVMKVQPHFIKIDWKNPRHIENEKWYLITEIKGNDDSLRMSHYLVFKDDKYQYRESKK